MIVKSFISKIKESIRNFRLSIFRIFFDKKDRKTIDTKNFLEKNDIRNILIVNKTGKIGDMVINSFIFREIKKRYPNIDIDVVARGISKTVIENNPYIHNIYDYEKDKLNELAQSLSKNKYDLTIMMLGSMREKEYKFLKTINSRFLLGINKKKWNMFDFSVNECFDYNYDDHMTKCYSKLLNKIGIDRDIDTSYDVFLGEKREKLANEIKNKYKNDKIVVINPYGAGIKRNFNEKTLRFIIDECKEIKAKIILLYYGDKYKEVVKIANNDKDIIVPESILTILDSALYIKISDLVISPDTGIVHIASAFNKKIIAVYQYPKTQLDQWIDYKIWSPNSKNSVKIIFPDGYLSKYDLDNEKIDINSIDLNEIKSSLKDMIL